MVLIDTFSSVAPSIYLLDIRTDSTNGDLLADVHGEDAHSNGQCGEAVKHE